MTSPDEKKPPPFFPPLTGDLHCVAPGSQCRWSWTFTERLTFEGVSGLPSGVHVCGLIVGTLHVLPAPGYFVPILDGFSVRPFEVQANEPMALDLLNTTSGVLWLSPTLVRADPKHYPPGVIR